jgi:hypothetical protein
MASNNSYSPPGETRMGIISGLETQQGIIATHSLESQRQTLSAGFKHSKVVVTHILAKTRIGVISRFKLQQSPTALTV